MAEDIGALVVKIEADARNFQTGLDNVTGKIDGLGSKLKGLGGLIAGAFAVTGIVNGIKSVTNEAKAAELASNRLNTLAKNVPGTTDAQIESLKQLAAEQQNLTTVEADAMITGQSQLATFQLSTDTIAKLTPAFADLAVATYGANVSSEQMIQSGNLIGKVMDGNVGALSRVGVSFTAAQEEILKTGTESEKAATLVEVLKQNFGGLAETTRNTTEGRMIALNNSIGDIKETVGTYLLPVLDKLADWLAKTLPKIQPAAEEAFQAIGGAVEFVSNAVTLLTEFFNNHWAILQPILAGIAAGAITFGIYQLSISASTIATQLWTRATTIATTAGKALNLALTGLSSPIGIAIAAIGLLVTAGVLLYQNWDTVKQKATEIWTDIKNFIDPIITGISSSFRTMVNSVIGALNGMIRGLNRISFDIPSWVPGLGGRSFGFSLSEIPTLARGTNFVPFDTLAFLHKGEAVVPAANNPANPSATNPAGIDYDLMAAKLAAQLAPLMEHTHPVSIDGQRAARALWPKFVEEKLRLGVNTL